MKNLSIKGEVEVILRDYLPSNNELKKLEDSGFIFIGYLNDLEEIDIEPCVKKCKIFKTPKNYILSTNNIFVSIDGDSKKPFYDSFLTLLKSNGVLFENPYDLNLMDGTFEAAEEKVYYPEKTLVFIQRRILSN